MAFLKKPSFLSKLSGDAEYDYFDDESKPVAFEQEGETRRARITPRASSDWQNEGEEGQLAVDIYQTQDAIVIKAFVAGIQPQALDISITREMVTISGERQDEREVADEQYFQRELYWGSFSRTILLPEEVDVDLAEATEKHGILMLRLPKINKKKETKLKVRTR